MLPKIIEAVFDGKVFQPTEPFVLESNTRVRITIEFIEAQEGESYSIEGMEVGAVEPYSFLHVLMAANLDGTEDWSENIHKYLYGNVGEAEE